MMARVGVSGAIDSRRRGRVAGPDQPLSLGEDVFGRGGGEHGVQRARIGEASEDAGAGEKRAPQGHGGNSRSYGESRSRWSLDEMDEMDAAKGCVQRAGT